MNPLMFLSAGVTSGVSRAAPRECPVAVQRAPVELGVVIAPACGQSQEVLRGARHLVAEHLDFQVAKRRVQRHRLGGAAHNSNSTVSSEQHHV